MAYNKIIYDKTVLLDLTKDTIQPDKLVKGYTAHDKTGELIFGTLETSDSEGSSIPSDIVAGDFPVAICNRVIKTNSTTTTATGLSMQILTKGTYRFKCTGINTGSKSTDATKTTFLQFYKNGVPVDKEFVIEGKTSGEIVTDIECDIDDIIDVYAKEGLGNTTYPLYITNFTCCIDWINADVFATIIIPDPDEIQDWVQPDGTFSYNIGDKVKYGGKIWICTVNNNVWQPGVYGWQEV